VAASTLKVKWGSNQSNPFAIMHSSSALAVQLRCRSLRERPHQAQPVTHALDSPQHAARGPPHTTIQPNAIPLVWPWTVRYRRRGPNVQCDTSCYSNRQGSNMLHAIRMLHAGWDGPVTLATLTQRQGGVPGVCRLLPCCNAPTNMHAPTNKGVAPQLLCCAALFLRPRPVQRGSDTRAGWQVRAGAHAGRCRCAADWGGASSLPPAALLRPDAPPPRAHDPQSPLQDSRLPRNGCVAHAACQQRHTTCTSASTCPHAGHLQQWVLPTSSILRSMGHGQAMRHRHASSYPPCATLQSLPCTTSRGQPPAAQQELRGMQPTAMGADRSPLRAHSPAA